MRGDGPTSGASVGVGSDDADVGVGTGSGKSQAVHPDSARAISAEDVASTTRLAMLAMSHTLVVRGLPERGVHCVHQVTISVTTTT